MLRGLFESIQLIVFQLPYNSCRNTCHKTSGGNGEPFSYKRACRHKAVFAYFAAVKEDRSHSYEAKIFNLATVNYRSMSDGYTRSYNSREFFVRNVYHTVVLNVCPFPYSDEVHIPPDNGIKPETRIPPYRNVAYDLRSFCNENAFMQFRLLPEVPDQHQSLLLGGIQPARLASFRLTTTLPNITLTLALSGTSAESALIHPVKSPVTPKKPVKLMCPDIL